MRAVRPSLSSAPTKRWASALPGGAVASTARTTAASPERAPANTRSGVDWAPPMAGNPARAAGDT